MVLNDLFSLIADNVLTLVLASAIIVILCYFRFFRDPPNYPPGPFRWPIFGNLFLFGGGKDFYAVLKDIQKKYGNVYRIKIGQNTVIFVFGHKNLTTSMGDNGANDRPDWLFSQKEIMKQTGIFGASGEKWEKLSKLIRQTQMTKNVSLNMERQVNAELEELCKYFSGDIARNPLDHFYNINLNIVSALVFGKRFSYDDPEFKHMSDRLKFIRQNILSRKEDMFSWIAYFTRSNVANVVDEIKMFHAFVKQKLDDHKASYDSAKPRDLLDMYIGESKNQSDKSISEIDLFQSVIDLFIGGYESYTIAVVTCAFYLVKYSDVQLKCRLEIKQNIPKGRPITMDDRDKLPYVTSTIKEILRIAKPAALSIQRTSKESLTIGEYVIPPKSVIVFELMDPQLDSSLWDKPHEFNPERWIKPHAEGYIPFGTGPRQCVAKTTADMSLFLLLSNMMKRFELKTDDAESLTTERTWNGIALVPKSFKLSLKPV